MMFRRLLNPLKSNSFFIFGARDTGKTTFLKYEFEDSAVHRLDLLENQIYSELLVKPENLEPYINKHPKEWVAFYGKKHSKKWEFKEFTREIFNEKNYFLSDKYKLKKLD